MSGVGAVGGAGAGAAPSAVSAPAASAAAKPKGVQSPAHQGQQAHGDTLTISNEGRLALQGGELAVIELRKKHKQHPLDLLTYVNPHLAVAQSTGVQSHGAAAPVGAASGGAAAGGGAGAAGGAGGGGGGAK